MKHNKLQTASLVLTVFSMILFLPPIVLIFASDHKIFGLPLAVVYFFIAWLGLILAGRWLASRLPGNGSADDSGANS